MPAVQYVNTMLLTIFDGTNDTEIADIYASCVAPLEVSSSRNGDVLSLTAVMPGSAPLDISVGDAMSSVGQLVSGDAMTLFVPLSEIIPAG